MRRREDVTSESTEDILKQLGGELPKTELSPLPGVSVEPPAPIRAGYLEEAANMILNQLTPSIRNYAFEVADLVIKVPRWQLLLGCLLAQHESGSMVAPVIDPAWRQMEIVEARATCEECKVEFLPKKFGQRYCSNQCGNLASARRIADIKAAQKKMDEDGVRAFK
jgi:hypothetical protein